MFVPALVVALIVAPVVCPYAASNVTVSSLNSSTASGGGAKPARRLVPVTGAPSIVYSFWPTPPKVKKFEVPPLSNSLRSAEDPVGAMPGYDFSFSGLKTSVLYFLKKETAQNPDFIQENLADLCASIQHTIIQTLLRQLRRAAADNGLTQIALAGGVAANSGLRQALQDEAVTQGWQVFIPAFQFCTDNAGMVAMTAHFQYEAGDFADQLVSSDPRLKLA